MEKFPDIDDSSHPSSSSPSQNGFVPSPQSASPAVAHGFPSRPDLWLPVPRRDGAPQRHGGGARRGRGHGRQPSLSNAFHNMRTRNGSVSQNALEAAEALKAPVSPKLVVLCLLWYTSSALTNTSSKSILMAFDKPATLTLVQFAFVSSLCIFFAWLASIFPQLRTSITALRHPIRTPTRDVILTTLPLAAFQIGGHLLSSTATARIPVSLVHTIKGLSPLFTVLAYRLIYDIRYPKATYFSLIPLTAGVMLACSGKSGVGGQLIGVIQALLATLIFVTQNIFSKKLFNAAAKAEAEGSAAQSRKLDKLNLLCYSSGMAFVITMPIWFWSEGITLIKDVLHDGSVDLSNKPNSMDHGRLTMEFVFNGIFHFGQNMLAFVLLSMVSPVTYSVASLIKRVFVIVLAIIWFRSPTTPLQAVGIGLTFLGLYLYDRTSESNKADRRARTMAQTPLPLLPVNEQRLSPVPSYSNTPQANGTAHPYTHGYFGVPAPGEDSKKTDEVAGVSHPRAGAGSSANGGWLPRGTKQEDTWRTGDRAVGVA